MTLHLTPIDPASAEAEARLERIKQAGPEQNLAFECRSCHHKWTQPRSSKNCACPECKQMRLYYYPWSDTHG